MARTLLLVFTLVVALQAINIDERYIRQAAREMEIEEEDVRTCASKTNITEDAIDYIEDFLRQRSPLTNLEDRVIRMGCYYACMFQKKGLMSDAHWNVDKVKEMITSDSKPGQNTGMLITVDVCSDRVKNETKECEAAVKFIVCYKRRYTM